jgi:NAD(P)-dependent dehydrogenase (short-subunit alcohol dehydrogenase family)
LGAKQLIELNLKGRTVLITGGSRGIGESIAHVMAQEGCSFTIAATDAEKTQAGGRRHHCKAPVAAHAFDLSKHENIKTLADLAGDCDILVNNAGARKG